MRKLSSENAGFKYILMIIDVFSKFGWVAPLKTKSGDAVKWNRWNRTTKTKLWKYFTANGTHKYIDIIQPLVDRYNSTKHRSIGCTPTDKKVQQFLHKKKQNSK